MLGLVNIIGREGLLARAATSLLSRETLQGWAAVMECWEVSRVKLRAADGEEIQGQTLEDQ